MAAENPASGAAELVTAFCKVCKSPAGGAGVVVVDKKLNIVDGTLTVVVVVVVVVVEVVDSVVEEVLAKEVDDLTVVVVVDIVVVVKSFK